MSISIKTVRIKQKNNEADATGYGQANNNYSIGKYEVTIRQYSKFLNSVASSDPFQLYNQALMTNPRNGGIVRSGSDGGYTYKPIKGTGKLPITGVNWFDAARFANWLANGQPIGANQEASTEDGVYSLNGKTSGRSVSRNRINPNTGKAPKYGIPTENEWYKAAYYSKKLNGGSGGYYRYATQSNAAPGNKIGNKSNQVNYILDSNGFYSVTQEPFVSSDQNYLSPVGSFTRSKSPYGTFDQNGGVWEIVDNEGRNNPYVPLRGGGWTSLASLLDSGYRLGAGTDTEAVNAGFRIVKPSNQNSSVSKQAKQKQDQSPEDLSDQPIKALNINKKSQITLDFATVGNPGNRADPITGFGAVKETFQLSTKATTIRQYTKFLNAVAKKDTNQLFNPLMQSDLNIAGIKRQGSAGNFRYSVINNSGSSKKRPITYVSWRDAARFANWMSNGQPRGAQNKRTTEDGAYNLRKHDTKAPPVNTINPNTGRAPVFFIPSEDQWYKAAYFSPEIGKSGGYYLYATQSNTPPSNMPTTGAPNEANLANNFVFYKTQSNIYDPLTNYLTDVGTFSKSKSFYKIYDLSGLVYEWNDLNGNLSPERGLRGGYWFSAGQSTISTTFSTSTIDRESSDSGFRIAALSDSSLMM
ncbi:MAG: SUMF1/EgtB/PvdO family nonheme iron enzyme [Cyanobacteriota bacterium]